jgi:hypothetical protein
VFESNPEVLTYKFDATTHCPPLGSYPGLQVKPHDVPLHVTVLAFVGLEHTWQFGPHVETELVSAQTPPHRL